MSATGQTDAERRREVIEAVLADYLGDIAGALERAEL